MTRLLFCSPDVCPFFEIIFRCQLGRTQCFFGGQNKLIRLLWLAGALLLQNGWWHFSITLSLPQHAGSAITETRMHDISSLFHFQLHATLYAAIPSPISSSFRERAATSWVLSCSFDSLQSTISNKHNFRQQYSGSRSSGGSQFQFNMVSVLLRANAVEWHVSLFCVCGEMFCSFLRLLHSMINTFIHFKSSGFCRFFRYSLQVANEILWN